MAMANNQRTQQTSTGRGERSAQEKQNRLHEGGSGGNEISTNNRRTFDIVIDGVAYLIQASAFTFNGETRFYVSIDNGEDHVFTWDSELGALRAIDDESGVIPDSLEQAISQQLQSRL